MKRLLVLRLSALGDVIHTIPAVAALREAMPDADISWIVEQPYAELVALVARVHAVPVRLKPWSRRPLRFRSDIRGALRAIGGCEASIDFQGLVKSAGIGWLSRAPERFGFAAEAIRERAALIFINRRVKIDRMQHVIDWNLQLAAALAPGVRPVAVDWSPFPAGSDERLRRRIVLLPAAGKASKQWPVERFRELAKRLGPRTLAVWGRGEKALAQATGAEVAPETNLRELAGLLRDAEVVIGGDTGPLHLAAAVGARVVGLYGPTDPRRNGPYGQPGSVIDHFSGSRSMDSIGVDEVLRKLDEFAIK